MAKRKEAAVPAIVDSVEALEAKMQAMREAQRKFAAFTQEQTRFFTRRLWRLTNSVSPLQKWR